MWVLKTGFQRIVISDLAPKPLKLSKSIQFSNQLLRPENRRDKKLKIRNHSGITKEGTPLEILRLSLPSLPVPKKFLCALNTMTLTRKVLMAPFLKIIWRSTRLTYSSRVRPCSNNRSKLRCRAADVRAINMPLMSQLNRYFSLKPLKYFWLTTWLVSVW